MPLLIAPILAGHADMTFGSRFAAAGDPLRGGMPLYRFLGNRMTTVVENALLGTRFSEMHSGMRAYTRGCLLTLPFLGYSNDFVFDTQLLTDAVTTRLDVVEVPIPTRYTKESSSIAIGASIKYIESGIRYAATKGWERGRRGSRYPFPPNTAKQSELRLRVPRPGGARRSRPPTHADLLSTCARFWQRGRRVSLVGGQVESPLPQPWTHDAETPDIISAIVDESDDAALESVVAYASHQLLPESMLILGGTAAGLAHDETARVLRLSGFHPMYWSTRDAGVQIGCRRTRENG